jgi:PAS domain S-box-containing protein
MTSTPEAERRQDGEVRSLCEAVDVLESDAILGYEELLPRAGFDAFLARVTPDDRDAVAKQMQRATETGGPWAVECRITRRDGAVRWILATGSPLRGAQGERRGVAGVVQDITGRKRSEEELRAGGARGAFLERLGDTLRGLSDPAEIQAAAARLLREHLGASRVQYVEAELGGELGIAVHDAAVGVPTCEGRHADADYPDLSDELHAGRTLVVTDASADSRLGPEERARYLALPVAALVVVPVAERQLHLPMDDSYIAPS